MQIFYDNRKTQKLFNSGKAILKSFGAAVGKRVMQRLAELDAAVAKMGEDPDFQADMAKLTYAGNVLTSAEAKDFIYGKRDAIAAVLDGAPDLEDLE